MAVRSCCGGCACACGGGGEGGGCGGGTCGGAAAEAAAAHAERGVLLGLWRSGVDGCTVGRWMGSRDHRPQAWRWRGEEGGRSYRV